jgi:hypothetical protein
MKSDDVKYEYKNGQLRAIAKKAKRDVELSVNGSNYVVGWEDETVITQVIPKDNIRILLEYLQQQYSLVNGRYTTAQDELKKLDMIDDKVVKVMENVTAALGGKLTEKDVDRLLRVKAPAFNELATQCLKKVNLRKTLEDLTPTRAELKEQIDKVVEVLDKIAKE